jgi:hypothetical protein
MHVTHDLSVHSGPSVDPPFYRVSLLRNKHIRVHTRKKRGPGTFRSRNVQVPALGLLSLLPFTKYLPAIARKSSPRHHHDFLHDKHPQLSFSINPPLLPILSHPFPAIPYALPLLPQHTSLPYPQTVVAAVLPLEVFALTNVPTPNAIYAISLPTSNQPRRTARIPLPLFKVSFVKSFLLRS